MQRAGAYVILAVFILCNVFVISNIFGNTALAKPRVEVNIFEPGSAYNSSLLQSLESRLGLKFDAANWYQDWATAFDPSVAQTYHSSGHIPELIWEPQLNGTGVSYADVTSGAYDTYITQMANSVKQLNFSIRISLAPEMNTDWTPWGIGEQGNTASGHVAFWRYVVTKFRDSGVTNVSWIWSPNVQPWNAQQLYGTYSQIFPGDAYVDYIGLDGYNWGTSQSWSEWQSFDQIFLSSYNEITKASGRNLLIMEMASAEQGGSKAAWITNMFTTLKNGYPRVQGFTWFDINKETDWRITSSTAAEQAFISGYAGNNTSTSPKTTPATPASKPVTASSSPAPTPAPTTNVPTATSNSTSTTVTSPIPQKQAGVYVAGEQTTTPSTLSISNKVGLATLLDFLLLLAIWLSTCHSASLTKRNIIRKKINQIDGLIDRYTHHHT